MELQEYIKEIECLKKGIQDCDNLIELYQNKKEDLQRTYEEMQKMELNVISSNHVDNMQKMINTFYILIKDIFKEDNICTHIACAPEDADKYIAFVVNKSNFEKLKEIIDNMYKYIDISLLKDKEEQNAR